MTNSIVEKKNYNVLKEYQDVYKKIDKYMSFFSVLRFSFFYVI
jgi:hypothetical protein